MASFIVRVLSGIQLGSRPLFPCFSLNYSSFTVTFDVPNRSLVISEAWISSGSKFKLPKERNLCENLGCENEGTFFLSYGGPHTEMVSHLVHARLLTGYSRQSHLLEVNFDPCF